MSKLMEWIKARPMLTVGIVLTVIFVAWFLSRGASSSNAGSIAVGTAGAPDSSLGLANIQAGVAATNAQAAASIRRDELDTELQIATLAATLKGSEINQSAQIRMADILAGRDVAMGAQNTQFAIADSANKTTKALAEIQTMGQVNLANIAAGIARETEFTQRGITQANRDIAIHQTNAITGLQAAFIASNERMAYLDHVETINDQWGDYNLNANMLAITARNSNPR